MDTQITFSTAAQVLNKSATILIEEFDYKSKFKKPDEILSLTNFALKD